MARTLVMASICRDCVARHPPAAVVCTDCGSSRLFGHNRLTELTIAHMDCDAFFAAIEKRDDPSLKGKPVLVGGGKRGVVSTCCYIARLYGVHSAMPMFKALKACPDAIVIRPNGEKYTKAARAIREKLHALTPLVQPVSIDEAYMDLSGTSAVHGCSPAESLMTLANDIERDIGITVSIGLSTNKFLAKTASELDKPRGFAAISSDEAIELLAPLSVRSIHGVGPQLAAKLAASGYDTVEKLQSVNAKDLVRKFGETGFWLSQRVRGIDNRPVRTETERKSVSSETTFNTDLSDPAALEDHLWKVCARTAERAKKAEMVGSVVTLKLKTSRFKTLTRRVTISEPTQLAQSIFRYARPMLRKETASGVSFRLIGVGLSNLSEHVADERDLLDPLIAKRAAAERASDAARAKFGHGAVMTGRDARMNQAKSKAKPHTKDV